MFIRWFKNQTITIRAAIIGATIPTIVALMIFLWPIVFPEDSRLEIVETGIVESSIFPQIDVRLRNTGGRVAFIKRANFNVVRIWKLIPADHLTSYVEPSQEYIVNLNVTGDPYAITRDLSQSIKPNEVDRFVFSLTNRSEKDFYEDYVFLLRIELIYDGDDKSLIIQDLMFATDTNANYECKLRDQNQKEKSEDQRRCNERLSHNLRTISEVRQIQALKSEHLKDLIETIQKISKEE